MNNTGNDVYWGDRLIEKRGKARRVYIIRQKKLRSWQVKNNAAKNNIS